MPELYVLRHGNTFDKGEVVTRVGGRTDLPLSASGRDQVAAIAAHFAAKDLRFVRVLSSPLKRALETSEVVRNACAPGVGIEPLEALREVDYGPDENRPEEEVLARIGAAAMAAWEADATPPPGWLVDVTATRVAWRALFDELAGGAAGPILAVTSNGVARFALDAADEVPANVPRKLKTAAWGVVRIAGDRRTGTQACITAWGERP